MDKIIRTEWSFRIARRLSDVAVLLWRLTTDDARQVAYRYLVHLTVLSLAIVVLGLGGQPLFGSSVKAGQVEAMPVLSYSIRSLPDDVRSTPEASLASAPLGGPAKPRPFNVSSDVEIVRRHAQPHTEVPHRLRLEVITYTVQPGDTVQGIAMTYGLNDTTIMWSNSAVEDMPDFLRIGQEIVILPIDGAYHKVKEGDTLESIAKKYKVDVTAITEVSYNNLEPPNYEVKPGIRLIVEGGTKPYVPKIVTAYDGPVPEGARGTGLFQWPATGSITQGYWWGHRAIDIAASTGTPIYAADGGFVSYAGWSSIGYGYLIVVDHANGYATYYAHLSGIYVSVGQAVGRGSLIGAMGSTGNSSGPHVHFEIRLGTAPLNPRAFLP